MRCPRYATTDDIWGGVTDECLQSVFWFWRAVVPPMQRQRGGSIVNFGSVLGPKTSRACPVHAYAAAEGGVATLTKTIAVHHAKDGLRCNSVAPVLTRTPPPEPRLQAPAARQVMEGQYPLGGPGGPDDITEAALYLWWDDAARTTGTVPTVDGGIMAQ